MEPHAFNACEDETLHLFPIDHPHCAEPGCGRAQEDPIHAVVAEGKAA